MTNSGADVLTKMSSNTKCFTTLLDFYFQVVNEILISVASLHHQLQIVRLDLQKGDKLALLLLRLRNRSIVGWQLDLRMAGRNRALSTTELPTLQ